MRKMRIFMKKEKISREKEKKGEESGSVSALNIENEMILFSWY